MIINDGALTLAAGSDGVQTATDFTVNGGTVNVTNAVEGLESKANLIINDGKVTVVANEDGLNSKTSMTINGGTISLTVSRGDGLDTAGPLKITGGEHKLYYVRQRNTVPDIYHQFHGDRFRRFHFWRGWPAEVCMEVVCKAVGNKNQAGIYQIN
jgi:hypothetical protein